MLAFNHVLAGSLVAVIVPAPLVPFVAVVSHFILDMTPHFDFSGGVAPVRPYSKAFRRWIIGDAVLCFASLGFAITLFPDQWLIISIGALFSAFPDFLWLFHHQGSRLLDKFLDWAQWIQWGERTYGWIFDAAYGMLFALTLYLLSTVR